MSDVAEPDAASPALRAESAGARARWRRSSRAAAADRAARSRAGLADRRARRRGRASVCALSNRCRGARAVTLRREPVPAAYRVFFRHIGLDPDVVRTPIEAAVLERMLHGGFLSRRAARGRPADRAGGHGRAGVGAGRRPPSTARSASVRAARASPRAAAPTRRCCRRPAGGGRRFRGAGGAVRRAGPGHEAKASTTEADAVRDPGRRSAGAVRGGGVVDVSRGARSSADPSAPVAAGRILAPAHRRRR